MADTIRILVATDNHVGAHERDPVRRDDSWKSFHEVMVLAKEREVDMVLLGGDLFHENKPSRMSMFNVMRSLRMTCLGARPCELEMLSDGSEHFGPFFGHANYEDPDINVSIPVFSIHGNHDDPSGEGHFAALDLLAMSGLINYFGRTPESDNIEILPLLLQKGRTKLAMYGMSNVRDERLYRTFRGGKVKFYQPGTQQSDWFQLMCVHQNHTAHTETSYLPENFLPSFLDLVIWGHEHECDIEPHLNPEMNFKVMQPGSSIATSLVPAEAVPKHVTILSITGREFKSEPIRLTTVRPFVYRDVVLSEDKAAVKISKKDDHRTDLTRHLISIVEHMIEEANSQWREAQEENPPSTSEAEDQSTPPLPLIRLRVETTAPDGMSKFDVENPQRFSQRFQKMVANVNDVVQFHSRKRNANSRTAKDSEADKKIMEKIQNIEDIKVEKLVREFLDAQSLIILPQNYFGDAVTQYVDKDDRHAMETFVNESLADQIAKLVRIQGEDDDDEDEASDLQQRITDIRESLEAEFAKGVASMANNKKRKPEPVEWDSDADGPWVDNPASIIRSVDGDSDNDDEDEEDDTPAPRATARGGRARGRGARGTTSTRARGAARGGRATVKSTPATTRGKKRQPATPDESEEDEDVVMLSDDSNEDSQAMFFSSKRATNGTQSSTRSGAVAKKGSTRGGKASSPATATRSSKARAAKGKQSTLSFTTSQQSVLDRERGGARRESVSDDIEDESEGFE